MTARKTRTANPFVGRWRIVEMEQWDREYIDLDGPGYFSFDGESSGEFNFGTVLGWLDCRIEMSSTEPKVEFSWEGKSDGDPACGRGWAVIQNGELCGHLYIHMSDDSSFVAKKGKGAI